MLQVGLDQLLQPTIEGMGYEYVGSVLQHGGARSRLCIYIDKEGGVTLDACAEVSRQVASVLDVEDCMPKAYHLEVSSPGLDRLLFTPAHYRRYVGSKLRVKCVFPIDGRGHFCGKLLAVNDEGIELDQDGVTVAIAFSQIKQARLVVSL